MCALGIHYVYSFLFLVENYRTCFLVSNLSTISRLLAALPFVVYPIFSTIDLFGIYQSLKHVHLQTLTKVSPLYCTNI